jgi:hypothetical protein
MNNRPKVLEINVETGLEIERDFTDDEMAELELRDIQAEQMLNNILSKVAARESALAKLAALGLTEEEIGAL